MEYQLPMLHSSANPYLLHALPISYTNWRC